MDKVEKQKAAERAMRGEENGRGQEIPRSSGGLALGSSAQWGYTWCNILHNSVMTAPTASRICLLWPFHTAAFTTTLLSLCSWCLQLMSGACLLGHFTSETDIWGDGRSSGAQVRCAQTSGDSRCPPKAPDADPFHAISLCVTNSHRSANGNGQLMRPGLEKEGKNC